MWSKETKEDPFAGFEMTPETLKKLCRELKLYSSCPELNEILHLHQKGIVKIKNLDEYVNLRTIYFECNAISKIEGLDHLVNLRCLYLNEIIDPRRPIQNLVEFITGLGTLKQLETLNLADNQIKTVQGLNNCTNLLQLNLSGNRIQSATDVCHLKECQNLQSLDLSKNKIDEEKALEVIRTLDLRLLRLVGNPIVSTTRHYRKTTIVRMPELQYMDDSPVFPKDRRLAEAWNQGGAEAETAMRETIKIEEAETRERHRKEFDDMINKARADAAMEKQAEKQREEEVALQSVEEMDVGDETVSNENNVMEEDQDEVLVLEKLSADARKRDASALPLEECPSPRRNWRGVEFIGSNIEIHGDSSMDQPMDLEATARYIEQDSNNAYVEASSTLLENTTLGIHNTTKPKINSGLAIFMDNSEGVSELSSATKLHTEESDLELLPSEDFDTNSQTTLDLDNTLAHNQEEQTRFSAQESKREFHWAEREQAFKRELQERVLRRAVMNANAMLEKGNQTTLDAMSVHLDDDGTQSTRPIIWGTEAYKTLWAKATEAANLIESESEC